MSIQENDPRDSKYIALYIAVKWHQEISADAAIRIADGRSNAKPGVKLTPAMLEQIKKIIESPNFVNINRVAKQFRVNKYEIFDALAGEKNANEEVLIVTQTERYLKKLKDMAENCTAVDCEKCPLDRIMCGESTLCEILQDAETDGVGRLKLNIVRQVSDKCPTIENLDGPTVKKTYRLHKQAADEIHQYAGKHPKEKIQDIISLALLEFVNRHK